MKRTQRSQRWWLFALGATILLGGAAIASARPIARSLRSWQVEQTRDPQIAGYDHWMRANVLPDEINEQVAMECRVHLVVNILTAAPTFHGQWLAITYINPVGASSLADWKIDTHRPLPIGTVLVKEKWPGADTAGHELSVPDPDALPELLTIMTKRTKGYWPAGGDWEYATATGDGRIVERGRLERCARCHVDPAASGAPTGPDRTFLGWYADQMSFHPAGVSATRH